MRVLRLLGFVAMASAALFAAEAPLRSPWDLHPAALTDAPYTCPAAPQLQLLLRLYQFLGQGLRFPRQRAGLF